MGSYGIRSSRPVRGGGGEQGKRMFRREKRGRGRESAYEVLMHPVMNTIYKIEWSCYTVSCESSLGHEASLLLLMRCLAKKRKKG